MPSMTGMVPITTRPRLRTRKLPPPAGPSPGPDRPRLPDHRRERSRPDRGRSSVRADRGTRLQPRPEPLRGPSGHHQPGPGEIASGVGWPTAGADGESVVLRLIGTQSVARPGGDVGAVDEAELAEDVLDVALGGALGDVHEGGDLLVGQAL